MLNIQNPQFPDSYSCEEECEDFLFKWRWPNGFNCPCCENNSCYVINTRKLYQCKECGMQVSVTSGTIMHNSKLPLWVWFKAMDLLTRDHMKISALTLADMLDVNYRSARLMLSKIQFAIHKLYEQQLSKSQSNGDTPSSILFGTDIMDSSLQEDSMQLSNEQVSSIEHSMKKEKYRIESTIKTNIEPTNKTNTVGLEMPISQLRNHGRSILRINPRLNFKYTERVPLWKVLSFLKGICSQSKLLTKWMDAFTSVQYFRYFLNF